MKRLSAIFFLTSLFTHFAFGQTANPAQQKERERWPDGTYKWTTDVSATIQGFGPAARVPYSNATLPVAEPSPDGRYFHVMRSWGDLTCVCTRVELQVFDSQAVRRWLASNEAAPPSSLRTVSMSTRGPRGDAIHDVVWTTDTTLVFVAWDDSDTEQYYRLDIPSGKLRQLTKERASSRKLGLFPAYVKGGTVMFWTLSRALPADAEESPAGAAPMMVAAPRDPEGRIRVVPPGAVSEWVAVHGDGEPWTLPVGTGSGLALWFTPDGNRAVLMPDKKMPTAQDGFFVLGDFARRKTQLLSEVAPGGRGVQGIPGRPVNPVAAKALWTADESEVVLVNAKLPAGEVPAGASADAGYIAAYEVKTGRWHVLEAIKPKPSSAESKIRAIGWMEGGKELLVAREVNGKPVEGTVYTRSGDVWVGRTVPATVDLPKAASPKKPTLPDGLKISVRQNANEPPVLMASDGTREKAMFGPDPALQGVGIAQVHPYKWRLPDGTEQSGLLALPRDFVKGNKPLPLVIQNGAIRSDVFLPDGSLPTGYARQALVSLGFAVLEVGLKWPVDEDGRPDPAGALAEGPGFVAQIDAAVETLAREGLIDPNRVGAIGHSRRGFQIHYAITHPGRVKLAAVEIWDSWTGAFTDYVDAVVRRVNGDTEPAGFERANGGPFWQNKASWLEHNVLFNVEKVDAATLFVDSNYAFGDKHPNRRSDVPLTPWMTIGAFELNRRPMEYVTIPEAAHVIPGAMFHKAAMDLTVDWMNFWLEGKEDPDPAKAEQYKRWRMIREKNEQRKAEEAKLGKTNGTSTTAAFGMPTPPAQTQTSAAPAAEVPDETAIQRVNEELKAAGIPEPQNMFPFNSMGYREMYVEKDMVKAEKLFRWNLILFPNGQRVADGLDSLGEYYVQAGDVDKAIEFYTKALEMKPTLQSKARQIIQRLKADPTSIGAIQEELRQDYINFTKSNPGE